MHIIERLWADQPGRYSCLSTKEPGCPPHDFWFDPDDCDVRAFIAEHEELSIYFCPHLFKARRRIKENAVDPKLLYADLDAVDPRRLDLEPTVAIELSPKRYVGLWSTDRAASDQLNKRMTYYTGADKGNWKRTQLLRVPGSVNHKYANKPKVLLLWDDGPTYKVSALEAKLPQVSPVVSAHRGERKVSRLSMTEIISRHELNGWLKRELLGSGRPVGNDGQRGYKVHWRIACELHEAGVPRDDAFVLLSETAWNKHTSDAPIWTMLDKIWD